MIVSISTFSETSAEMDEGVRHIVEEVVPSIRGAVGLRAGYWAVDHEGGKRISVMVWDSGEAMTSAMPEVAAAIKRIRDEAGRGTQRSPDSSQRFEVVARV